MADRKNAFILYTDYWEHIEMLSMEERGELFTAIFNYANDGNVPELPGAAKMAFSFIRKQLDRDISKWEEKRRERSESGKKGAAARWNKV